MTLTAFISGRNRLRNMEPTTFMAARKLQSVYLHDNLLPGGSPSLFSSQTYLQFADFSRSVVAFGRIIKE